MYTRNAGDRRLFWQGPSIGFDAGADGDRTMMLVYNLPSVRAIYQRFAGLDGSAYFVGGFGITALAVTTSWWFRSAPASAPGSASISAILNSPSESTWNPF